MVHDDQESRHSNCGIVHDLSAATDKCLVQQPYCIVPAEHWNDPSELRIAQSLLRGENGSGHFGCDGCAVLLGAPIFISVQVNSYGTASRLSNPDVPI